MTPQLPKDLGGLQKLADHVIVQEGDVWVRYAMPRFLVSAREIGSKVGELEFDRAPSGWHLYRRIPLPSHDHGEANPPFESTTKVTVGQPDTQFANSEGKALTYDDGKPPLACLPLKALREVAMVQLYGQQKYGDFYNYKKGMELSRNASCAMRHIADYMDGQDNDAESGRSHLAHAACRLLFMLENLADGKAIDDRFKP